MKCSLRFAPFWMLFAIAGSLLASPTAALAQSQGQNAVYNSAAVCCTGSSAFFDANMFLPPNGTQASDICDAIYYVLTHGYVAGGGVIDARGIGTALTCTKGSPWNESGSYVNKPSTILPPAGTINISTTWVLPNGTILIGEGTSNPVLNLSNNQLQTTIQATSTLSSGPMIQFGDFHCPGSPLPTCTGISIESLTLVGNNQALTGIENQNSQDRSYVRTIRGRN